MKDGRRCFIVGHDGGHLKVVPEVMRQFGLRNGQNVSSELCAKIRLGNINHGIIEHVKSINGELPTSEPISINAEKPVDYEKILAFLSKT